MYLFLSIFIPILLILVCIMHTRKKKNIQKVSALSFEDKYHLINDLVSPFGYCYIPSQDIFSTRIDAWQRDYGYCALYDRASVHFNMVFDSFPVYFDYGGRTWLAEFWKGQYGINTGCEMGLYYADGIIDEANRNTTLFKSVEDADMPKMSFLHSKNQAPIANLRGRHWWLTAFHVGCFSQPAELSLRASLTFPTTSMAIAFTEGLLQCGYSSDTFYRRNNMVTLSFTEPHVSRSFFRRMRIGLAQWSNRLWCKAYMFFTRPFTLSLDRILYLYYYLPFAFRKTLRIRRYKNHKNTSL